MSTDPVTQLVEPKSFMKLNQADEIKEHMNDGSIKALLNHACYISLTRNPCMYFNAASARGEDKTGSRTPPCVFSSRSTESLRDPTTHPSTDYTSACKFVLANTPPPLLTTCKLSIHWTAHKLPL